MSQEQKNAVDEVIREIGLYLVKEMRKEKSKCQGGDK